MFYLSLQMVRYFPLTTDASGFFLVLLSWLRSVDDLILLQVTRSVDTEYGQLSPQEQKTVQAIVEAR